MSTHRAFLVGLLCLGSACEENPASRIASPTTLVPPGTVQVLIQQDRSIAGDSAVFIVSIVPNGVPLAAYQGVVTFAPEVIQAMKVNAADADGEFRVVNSEELKTGRIRFAVFGAESLKSTEAFRIVAHVHGDVSTSQLAGSIDVAGLADGASLGASQLRRSVGVYDAATNANLVR